MDDANLASQDVQAEHIGPPPHPLRNLLILGGLAVMAGLILLFYWQTGSRSEKAAQDLELFRQAVYEKCKDEQFAGKAHPELIKLFGTSSRMRSVVAEQHSLLRSGRATCEQVMKALRSVDFPLR